MKHTYFHTSACEMRTVRLVMTAMACIMLGMNSFMTVTKDVMPATGPFMTAMVKLSVPNSFLLYNERCKNGE